MKGTLLRIRICCFLGGGGIVSSDMALRGHGGRAMGKRAQPRVGSVFGADGEHNKRREEYRKYEWKENRNGP